MTIDEFAALIDGRTSEDVTAALNGASSISTLASRIAALTTRIDSLADPDAGGQPDAPDTEAIEKSINAYFTGREG